MREKDVRKTEAEREGDIRGVCERERGGGEREKGDERRVKGYEKNRLRGKEEVDEREKELPVCTYDKEGAEREGGGGSRHTYRQRLCVCVCVYACMCGRVCLHL